MNANGSVEQAAERVLDLEAELESASNATTKGEDLKAVHAALHEWVDSVVGAVVSPGVGRVTLIHENGRETKIASADLPFLLSKPVTF